MTRVLHRSNCPELPRQPDAASEFASGRRSAPHSLAVPWDVWLNSDRSIYDEMLEESLCGPRRQDRHDRFFFNNTNVFLCNVYPCKACFYLIIIVIYMILSFQTLYLIFMLPCGVLNYLFMLAFKKLLYLGIIDMKLFCIQLDAFSDKYTLHETINSLKAINFFITTQSFLPIHFIIIVITLSTCDKNTPFSNDH